MTKSLDNLQNIEIIFPMQKGDYIDIVNGKYIHMDKNGKPRERNE